METLPYPHCQRAVAVIYRLAEVAVVREPGCDQELGNIHTITSHTSRITIDIKEQKCIFHHHCAHD